MTTASTTARRRVGRTLRRTRGAPGVTAPLRAIEENTVIDIAPIKSLTAKQFRQSPPLKPANPSMKIEKEPLEIVAISNTNKRKRERESATVQPDPATRAAAKKTPPPPLPVAKKSAKQLLSATAAAAELDKKTQQATQLLEELEKILEKRCADLMVDAERKSEELRMELKVQLMFLPESVRAMPWKTFIEDFGGSLDNVIQNVKEQDYMNYVTSQQMTSPKSALKIRPAPSTVRSKDRRSNGNTPGRLPESSTGLSTPSATYRGSISNYSTPMFTPSTNIPSTVVRTARKGEVTYSIRGSPIVPDSISKAPVGSLVATFQGEGTEPLACITLDNETAVDLTNPDMLSEETRAQARSKLEALQAKVNALLRQFK